jgi:hypothetical protein
MRSIRWTRVSDAPGLKYCHIHAPNLSNTLRRQLEYQRHILTGHEYPKHRPLPVFRGDRQHSILRLSLLVLDTGTENDFLQPRRPKLTGPTSGEHHIANLKDTLRTSLTYSNDGHRAVGVCKRVPLSHDHSPNFPNNLCAGRDCDS